MRRHRGNRKYLAMVFVLALYLGALVVGVWRFHVASPAFLFYSLFPDLAGILLALHLYRESLDQERATDTILHHVTRDLHQILSVLCVMAGLPEPDEEEHDGAVWRW